MTSKPIIHGRDHRRGGADPILDTSVPYAILKAGGTLSAGPTLDKFWWDLLPPGPTDFTNAPDVFANNTLVIAGAGNVNTGTFHGLSILKPGMYKAHKTIQILSLYNDTTLRAITIYHSAGLTYTSDMVFGDQNHMNQGHGFHFELWSIDNATAPTATLLLNSVNGESSSYTCNVNLFVEKLDPTSIEL